MKIMKNHWPIVVTVFVFAGSVFDFRIIGASSSDALGMGLLFFYILMPLCAFFASLWYGYKWKRKVKWLLVAALGLLELLVITVSTGDWDFGHYWSMAFWTMIPSTIGISIGSLIGRSRKDTGR